MNFPTTKGQSDTFKLLIAAVVAMAILAIVASVLNMIKPDELSCVNDPLNEIVDTMSKAMGALDVATTRTLCLQTGSVMGERGIINKIEGVSSVEFSCLGTDPICTGTTKKVETSGTSITALSGDPQFKAQINCDPEGTAYKCYVKIRSPTDIAG